MRMRQQQQQLCMHTTLLSYVYSWDTCVVCTVDSAPSVGVYFFVVDLSVCLSVTLLEIDSSFLFLDGIEPFFWPSVLHDKNYTTVFFDDWFKPLMPKIYSQKFASVGHWVSHGLWVMVYVSTKFGLGTESLAYRLVAVLSSLPEAVQTASILCLDNEL